MYSRNIKKCDFIKSWHGPSEEHTKPMFCKICAETNEILLQCTTKSYFICSISRSMGWPCPGDSQAWCLAAVARVPSLPVPSIPHVSWEYSSYCCFFVIYNNYCKIIFFGSDVLTEMLNTFAYGYLLWGVLHLILSPSSCFKE